MSDTKPITGELRDAMCEWGWVERDGSIMFTTSPIPTSIDAEQSLAISRSDFDYLCDEIDAIHAGLERENAALVTARELRAENAKLREYARKLLTGYECGRGELCEGCSWNGWDGDCNARMKARELGIEVES